MGKRNKVRYTAKEVQRIEIILTGTCWVQFLDEDISARAAKGDVLFYAHYSGQSSPAVPDYEVTGYVGYLKMDVFDGKNGAHCCRRDCLTMASSISRKASGHPIRWLCVLS